MAVEGKIRGKAERLKEYFAAGLGRTDYQEPDSGVDCGSVTVNRRSTS
jgi:hypothetical protein